MLLYLLIGFWYHKESAHTAAMKAFVVNRVGDFGFVLGIIAIFALTGSVSFDAIFASVVSYQAATVNIFGLPLPALEVVSFFYLSVQWEISTLGASYLVTGCYGRTYPCICAHPCCNHGDGRRIFGMPNVAGHEYAPVALEIITIVGDYRNFCSDGRNNPI